MNKTLFSSILCLHLLAGLFLSIHNGRIGVWKDGQDAPYRVIPCPVWVLSHDQQQMLRDGIRIDSIVDVDQLLTRFFPEP